MFNLKSDFCIHSPALNLPEVYRYRRNAVSLAFDWLIIKIRILLRFCILK